MEEIEKDKLSYCLLYKGEEYCPEEYTKPNRCTPQGKIWAAEKWVCTECILEKKDKQREFYMWVLTYISKWDPYNYHSVWKIYHDILPKEYKSKISIE